MSRRDLVCRQLRLEINSLSSSRLCGRGSPGSSQLRFGFTLIELLVAMAITLVMMAAVVTIFANVGQGIRNRRATIEMNGQLRHARNLLQRDLANATCPAVTWQRPEWNRGYIEIVEGGYSDQFPSIYTDGIADTDEDQAEIGGTLDELDPGTSQVPRGNDGRGNMGMLTHTMPPPPDPHNTGNQNSYPIGMNGLGDWDDILALTVRNESDPFVGRVPGGGSNPETVREDNGHVPSFADWGTRTIRSPLAEVIWFALENPMNDTGGFMGEPGFRTIYRRVLLIAPWITPYRFEADDGTIFDTFEDGGRIRTRPGMVRVFPEFTSLEQAIAGVIAFQERYDLSVRLEFDPMMDADDRGRYVIMANTLGDLTKRENRFEHFGFRIDPMTRAWSRLFPFALVASGRGYSNDELEFVYDPELGGPASDAQGWANFVSSTFRIDPENLTDTSRFYSSRPFVHIHDDNEEVIPATARAVLNDDGQVVYVTDGLVPLWGPRRGEDVILSDVLAFDIRVYDPGAPLYPEPGLAPTDPYYPGSLVEPSDPGWPYSALWDEDINMSNTASEDANPVGAGAYVDMAYWSKYYGLFCSDLWECWDCDRPNTFPPVPGPLQWDTTISGPYNLPMPLFAGLPDRKSQLNKPVYDTWSFHYENNGLNEDDDYFDFARSRPMIDEGTNGLDDPDPTPNDPKIAEDGGGAVLGPDDMGERETSPPYDVPLRGIQVKLRVYERDSRQMREVDVRQHFVPE